MDADGRLFVFPDDTLAARIERAESGLSALLETRLRDARRQGCDIAVITTAPGSTSQQNAQRRGCSLLYARALHVKQAGR